MYWLTIHDPQYKEDVTEELTTEEAREFVHWKGTNEEPHAPWRWILVNAAGFVVSAFDNLRMFGGKT